MNNNNTAVSVKINICTDVLNTVTLSQTYNYSSELTPKIFTLTPSIVSSAITTVITLTGQGFMSLMSNETNSKLYLV